MSESVCQRVVGPVAFDGTKMTLGTDLRFHTDIAASIIETAHEWNASAIVLTPRGGSRWRKLLTGDVTHNPVANSDIPILVQPDRAGATMGDARYGLNDQPARGE